MEKIVLNKNTKLSMRGCSFYLEERPLKDSADDIEYCFLSKKSVKKRKRVENKSGISIAIKKPTFHPIDQIVNPTDFAELLYKRVKNSHEKYEARLLQIRVLSRIIGRCKFWIQGYLIWLSSKYFRSNQR